MREVMARSETVGMSGQLRNTKCPDRPRRDLCQRSLGHVGPLPSWDPVPQLSPR